MTESPATVASPLSRSLPRPLLAFTACAAIYMVLDAYGLRGPWMASMKIVPIAILALLALRSLIALNKFVIPLPMAGTAIMVTYYGAQLALLYGLARARA